MNMKPISINEELIFKYLSGKATEEEGMQLLEWLSQNDENKKNYSTLKRIYLETGVNLDSSIDAEKAYERFLNRIHRFKESDNNPGKKSGRFIIQILKYAAVILIVSSVGFLAYYLGKKSHPLTAEDTFEIDVPYGGKSSLVLPDGSIIWLNAGSHLKYGKDFNYKTREVYLEGEALFNVEKKNLPFIVHTSHLDVFVTGTIFNVKSYPDENEIETTLIEGNINIVTQNTKKSVSIKPNQMLSYRKKIDASEILPVLKEKSSTIETAEVIPDNIMVIYKDVDIREAVSWRSGALTIEGETLEGLVKKLERKFDVTFTFEDAELKEYSYSGTLLDLPLEQVLQALRLTSPVNYTISEKSVKLSLNNDFIIENGN
jgi:ferric-dicitrate binding protein FerR (iron transport regulator)